MLVFTRQEGETLVIRTPDNQEIEIKLARYWGDNTEVGIEIPDGYEVVKEDKSRLNHVA